MIQPLVAITATGDLAARRMLLTAAAPRTAGGLGDGAEPARQR